MKISLVALVVFAAFISGCGVATRATFIYLPGDNVNTSNKKSPQKVAVLPLEDKRMQNNNNAVFLYLIPLMPYGTMEYDRPDAANGFMSYAAYNFKPSEDIAKAVVVEMEQNKIFEKVYYTQRENEPGVDMIVTGEVRTTKYSGKLISYGLSAFGPALWGIGLPSEHITNQVDFTVMLKRVTDGAVIFKHDVKGEWSNTMGLYYNRLTEFNGFPIIIRDGLTDGMKKLLGNINDRGELVSNN